MNVPISKDEIKNGIENSRYNSTPGPEGISYGFYKHTPSNLLLHMGILFKNNIEKENIPESWSKKVMQNMVMLYKKGDKDNPENYRDIALVNCILKLFTQVRLNRFLVWDEVVKMLPESQAGFRKGRSCMDNIFVHSAAMNCISAYADAQYVQAL